MTMMMMVLTTIMVVVMAVDLPQRISPTLTLGPETVRQPAATLVRDRPSARNKLLITSAPSTSSPPALLYGIPAPSPAV